MYMIVDYLKTGLFIITEDNSIGVVAGDNVIYNNGTFEPISVFTVSNDIIMIIEGNIGFASIEKNYYKIITGQNVEGIKIIYDKKSSSF